MCLYNACSGAPGLVDRAFAIHAGSSGFHSHRRHMSERFFRSNRPGYPHPVSSELENSGTRVAASDCSVIERRLWRPPYQTGKTVRVHAKTLQTQRGRTHGARCVRQWFRTAEALGERRYENWNTHTVVQWFNSLYQKLTSRGQWFESCVLCYLFCCCLFHYYFSFLYFIPFIYYHYNYFFLYAFFKYDFPSFC